MLPRLPWPAESFVHPSSLKTKITTGRLAETRAFYIDCLGMHVVEEWQQENDVGCILSLAGGGREALLEIYEGPQPGDLAALSLQFRTDDLAAFEASLPPGTRVRGPVKRPWGSAYLYLTDPNGITVVVYEGGH
jgi:catechol 2,3-dioxygenase-like lactoylglutathione lyase family enzyme